MDCRVGPGNDKVKMPTIYYIRHGETEWNALGRLQGVRDVPLNDLGREQAVRSGAILGELPCAMAMTSQPSRSSPVRWGGPVRPWS